ncbi:MAG: hypothetical protein M3114_05115 [Thermoproteota archaeon]|nr:hypothetical protein [Thermoproteota archaeon]
MEKVALFLAVTLFLSFLAFNLPPVLAHEEVVMGDISIVAGWVDEPPLVNQLNGIVLIVTQVSNGQPVNNALAQADITLQKGGETRPLEFQPSEEAGTYTATILPTQTGQYAIVMRGTIAGQAIDGQIEIEDVEDTARFSFPPATTTNSSGSNNQIPQGLIEQLQRVITDLTTQVEEANIVAQEASNATQMASESIEELKMSADRAYLFSLIGVGAGAAGIAIGVVAFSRREKI